MKKSTPESYRHMLVVLFWLFETMLVASVVTLLCFDRRWNPQISSAGAVIWIFSFVGQLIVCFLLRRIARPLAIVGWFTLFGSVLIGLLTPQL
jgi:FtsH-binding integral membrane protein